MKREGVKRLAAWAIWVGVWGLGLAGCNGEKEEPPFYTDPRLIYFVANPPYAACYPQFSPDGQRIYYCMIDIKEHIELIYVLEPGNSLRPLYVGGVNGFSISPDNALIVASNRDSNLILLDTSGVVMDTIVRDAISPVFVESGRLYYFAFRNGGYGVYRRQSVSDTTEELVISYSQPLGIDPFDVSWDESKLLLGPYLMDLSDQSIDNLGAYYLHGSLDPTGQRIALISYHPELSQIVFVLDLTTDSMCYYDTRSYRCSFSYFPSWSPSGDTLVFSNWVSQGEPNYNDPEVVVGVFGFMGMNSNRACSLLHPYRAPVFPLRGRWPDPSVLRWPLRRRITISGPQGHISAMASRPQTGGGQAFVSFGSWAGRSPVRMYVSCVVVLVKPT